MKSKVLELAEREYMVLDGAMGTMLQEMGLTPEEVPEEWNLTHKDKVVKVHLSYLNAGAQIIETNTFGGSYLKLKAKGKESLLKNINEEAVNAAKEAIDEFYEEHGRDDPRFIAGSIGPSGKIYNFEVKEEELVKSYADQMEVLANRGIDLFLIETMMDLNEAKIAVNAAKKVAGLPVFASMVFNKTESGEFRTLFGNTVKDSVRVLLDEGAEVVGVNCGLLADYIEVVKKMREMTDSPIILYPNAGIPRLLNNRTVFDQKPEEMIKLLDASIEAGATIIGGCCGTTPEYIKMIAEKIKGKPRIK